MAPRYFELNDDVGVEPEYVTGDDGQPVKNPKAGELQPITEVGFVVAVPRMVKGELLTEMERVKVKPIEGTRVLKADHPNVASALQDSGQYHEIDPPKSEQPRKPKSEEKE